MTQTKHVLKDDAVKHSRSHGSDEKRLLNVGAWVTRFII
jgi:hypothetical protein